MQLNYLIIRQLFIENPDVYRSLGGILGIKDAQRRAGGFGERGQMTTCTLDILPWLSGRLSEGLGQLVMLERDH